MTIAAAWPDDFQTNSESCDSVGFRSVLDHKLQISFNLPDPRLTTDSESLHLNRVKGVALQYVLFVLSQGKSQSRILVDQRSSIDLYSVHHSCVNVILQKFTRDWTRPPCVSHELCF